MTTPTPSEPLPREPLEIDAPAALRRLIALVIGAELALVLVDFLFAYLDLVDLEAVQHLANLAREDGVGTWFSAIQDVGVGLVLVAVGLAERASKRGAGGWWFLAAFFTYIGLDDGLEIHERLGSAVKRITHSPAFDVFPTYAWQLVFGPAFGAVGLFMAVFLWRRLADPRLRLGVAAGLGCLVAAVGFDFLEGIDGLYDGLAQRLGVVPYTVSHASKVTEELLEMLGMTAFLATFGAQLALSLGERPVVLRVSGGAGKAPLA